MQRSILAVLVCGFAADAAAITEQDGNAAIQFNFSNPGARSLGMGGAFLGRADDASAAYTNPAGITQLTEAEVSAEFRRYDYSTEFLSHGTYAPPFSGDDLRYATDDSEASGLSFLSAVFPFERFALAAYRHEYIDYNTRFSVPSAGNPRLVATIGGSTLALEPFEAAIDLQGVNYGFTGAFSVNESLSLGVSLIYSIMEIESSSERLDFASPTRRVNNRTEQNGEDERFAFNIGALWQATDSLRIGAVYRGSPDFGYDVSCQTVNVSVPNSPLQACRGFPKESVSFSVPDAYGVGFAYQVSDAFGFSLDVNRIEYSDITVGLRSAFLPDGAAQSGYLDRIRIEDGTEIRLGAEYSFLDMTHPLSIRAGVWRDPRHTMRFEGQPSPNDAFEVLFSALFSTGDDEIHYSAGLGWSFKSFQIDAAVDFSDRVDTFSLSGVVRFD